MSIMYDANKMSTEDRITRAKIQLQKHSPFFAYLIMNMSIREDKKGTLAMPTLGVDCKGNCIYNAKFIDSLTDSQLKGVLCHETLHVALLHLLRREKKDPMWWNIACDAVINFMILNEGIEKGYELPENNILPDRHTGEWKIETRDGKVIIQCENKTANEVYEQLMRDIPECDCMCHKPKGKKKGKKKGGKQAGPGGPGNCCPCQGLSGFDNHTYGDKMSEAEKEAVKKDWQGKVADAATAAKARGDIPGSLKRLLEELLNPKLNWKTILYQFLTKDIPYNFTMKKPGRRSYATGIYLPTVLKENLKIVATIDCSGSISKTEYQSFVGEIYGITNAFEQVDMDILFWDTKVHKRVSIRGNDRQKLLNMTIPGGGGTTMGCLYDYYENQVAPQLMVHLTDGYTEDEPRLPMSKHLFVISSRGISDNLIALGQCISLD